MERGYVKLWRKTVDTGLLHNPEIFTFFAWAMMKATHRPHSQLVGSQIVDLEPGQFVTGTNAAAEELKTTPRKIRTALSTLEKLKILTRKTTNKYSVITIVKWDIYQHGDALGDTHTDKQTTSKRQAGDNKQEQKNRTTEEQKSKTNGRFTPPTIEEVREYCIEKGYTFDPETFWAHHNTRGWELKRGLMMKCWRSACTTFQKNERTFGGKSPAPTNLYQPKTHRAPR